MAEEAADHPVLHVIFLGLSLSAKGALAVCAAPTIVLSVVAFHRL
ncbi:MULTISPECIES: hypothetical protein [unclassified Bradyrhizobium]|nr:MULTISPECIES: hypothetical protein [unclassified Bradyrhizobium]